MKFKVHIGVHGFVSSTIGHRIPHAEIVVEGIKHTVRSAQDGDYWRLLLPGKYNITFAARGYETYTSEIVSLKSFQSFYKLLSYFKVVPESGSLELNPILMKDDPEHWASAYDFAIHPNVYYPAYHSGSDIYSVLSALENQYPDSAEFHGGDDLVSMAIHWLKISQHVREF